MLDISYQTKENAIEEIVYDFLKNSKRQEMSDDTTELFLRVGLMPKDVKIPKEDKPFIFQVMEKRVEYCFTFKITDERVFLILCTWIENVGSAILYLWYIQAWCFKNNVREVDLDTLAMRIFPLGTFAEEDLKSVWDSQKVQHNTMGSDNLVDYASAGSSIQFID